VPCTWPAPAGLEHQASRAAADVAAGRHRARAPRELRQLGSGQHVHLRRADELRDELVGRPVVQLQRRAHLLDLAVAQHHHAVGQRHRLDLVVGDVDRRRAQLAVQLGDLDRGLAAQGGVEVGQRLVEQEHLGRSHDGAADRHPLALAAGQLAWRALQVRHEVEDLRGPLDLVADRRGIGLGELEREAHVLEHAHVRVQRVALEHHREVALAAGSVVMSRPSSSSVPPSIASRPAISRSSVDLPQPGRADEDDELAALDRQVDALDGAVLPEVLLDAAQLQEAMLSSPWFT
jgi:hypothetical protein